MRIAIIGSGFSGLTAAYYLSKNGHKVTIYEKESTLGGLANGFKEKNWQWSLEKYYHHFFANDKEVLKLVKELNVENKLFFKKPITSIFLNKGRVFLKRPVLEFDTPFSLLVFPYLSFFEKIKTGLTLLFLKLSPPFKFLERTTAFTFLEKTMGKRSFEILFKPLLVNKFGSYADKVSALWFWARIKKRTQKLGYFTGGLQELIDILVVKLKENKTEIFLNHEVKEIKRQNNQFLVFDKSYDVIINNIPTPIFINIAPFLPKDYLNQLSKINHLSALSLVLVTDKPFLKKTYWLNINETNFPFLSVVQHTNFIDKKYYGSNYLAYLGNYLPQNHPYLKKSKEELIKIFLPYLNKISHDTKYIIHNTYLFKNDYAQTVVTTNYHKIKPTIETPIKNLYLLNIDVIYPWDRGVNYAIELGEMIAKKITGE